MRGSINKFLIPSKEIKLLQNLFYLWIEQSLIQNAGGKLKENKTKDNWRTRTANGKGGKFMMKEERKIEKIIKNDKEKQKADEQKKKEKLKWVAKSDHQENFKGEFWERKKSKGPGDCKDL